MFLLFNAFLFACGEEEGAEPTEPPGTQIGTEDAVPEEDTDLDSTIDSDTAEPTPPDPLGPSYSIEGKWIWSPSENRADANTMYEFVDGARYTSYAVNTDFNDLDSSDRIPGSDPYTLNGDTLVIDETPFGITFECDGGIVIMNSENGPWSNQLWRLSSDCQ